ncbi:MAG TPA: heavy metal-binding domain-containing protein [Mucilaginibacter sp.]
MKAATIIFMSMALCLGACGNAKQNDTAKKHYKYTCTMHPDVGSDKPGVCPKCGMELVEKEK